MRVVHCMDAYWWGYYKDLLHRKPHPEGTWPTFAHGGLPHRRREMAFIIANCVPWRMLKAEKSFLACSFDLVNAFGSSDQRKMIKEQKQSEEEPNPKQPDLKDIVEPGSIIMT